MIQTNNPNKCCGCLVCSVVCPQKCIERVEDSCGFVMSKVDASRCINCGACERVCPIQKNYPKPAFTGQSAYAAYSKDAALRKRASSGGMFETVAQFILAKGGSVFACKLDEDLQLRMHEATTIDQARELTKSKYIQSRCHDMFPVVKERVQEGKPVLVCATPCQIAALQNYLGTLAQAPNVYLMDFFCHGVPSQRFFDKCREYVQNKHHTKWLSYGFRFKPSHGTTLHYTRYIEQTLQGEQKERTHFYFEDPFYLGFTQYITLRDSCYQCPFGSGNHTADITVGDLHDAETSWPQENLYKGLSKVVINTSKGQELWQVVQGSLCTKPLSVGKLFPGPTHMPVKRPAFMTDLQTLPFEIFVGKWLNPRKQWKKAIYYRLPDFVRHGIKKVCLVGRNFYKRSKK